jgi:glycosyltransferase involved in cell wall biosynthesis
VRFLFVHQNFPGQYLHIVRNLVAEGGHEILFMTEPNRNNIVGVRKVTYARPPSTHAIIHPDAREFELAMRRAEAALSGGKQIKALGFQPDIIIGHHGWGELLSLCDLFPGVPILGYFEFYYRSNGGDVNFDPEFPIPMERFGAVRAKNAVNHLALTLGHHGQTPTIAQWHTYPDWAQKLMTVIQEGVNLEQCSPNPAGRRQALTIGSMKVTARQKLVTFVARNLEPYRGFHTLMRALPKILDERSNVVVSIVGGDEVSYGAMPDQGGSWREVMLAELAGKLDLSRIHFHGKVPYEQHLALLKRSDAHIYLSYPFVASWSLREAMAVGCTIIGSDTETVTEFIHDGETGLITPGLNPKALALRTLEALEDKKLATRLGANARQFAVKHLDLADYLTRYRAEIERVTGKQLAPPSLIPTRKSSGRTVRPKGSALLKPARG